jgi:nucleoside-diphosphate-sugar epimerase
MKSLKILLIGGSGFVSGTLARAAIQAGHHVWAITRGQRPLPEGVTGVTVDRHDHDTVQRLIGEVDAHWDLVVDVVGFQVQDARQDIEVFSQRAKHLVFISTDFVYEPSQRRFPQTEEPAAYNTSGYGGRKRACEQEFLLRDTGDMAWTILRPPHIYGPGSLLGCLPMHGRDPALIQKLQAGEALQLVGGGHFLQQPVFAADLAGAILSCAGNPNAHNHIFNVAGPDVIESRRFYHIVADILDVELRIEEIPVDEYRRKHPDRSNFLCHRFYNRQKMRDHHLKMPQTPLQDGLKQHVASILATTKE